MNFHFRVCHSMKIWISHTKPLSGIIRFWPSFTHFFSPIAVLSLFLPGVLSLLFLLHCSRLCVEENQSQMLHGNRSKRIIPFLFLSPLPPPVAQSLVSTHVMCSQSWPVHSQYYKSDDNRIMFQSWLSQGGIQRTQVWKNCAEILMSQ